MEEEKFFSGYCRQVDQSRMVSVCKEDGELLDCDCCYGSCVYQQECTIGKSITDWLNQE